MRFDGTQSAQSKLRLRRGTAALFLMMAFCDHAEALDAAHSNPPLDPPSIVGTVYSEAFILLLIGSSPLSTVLCPDRQLIHSKQKPRFVAAAW